MIEEVAKGIQITITQEQASVKITPHGSDIERAESRLQIRSERVQ